MTPEQKEKFFQIANDFNFLVAVQEAEMASKNKHNPFSFHTIGDRMRLLEELEKQGYQVSKIKPVQRTGEPSVSLTDKEIEVLRGMNTYWEEIKSRPNASEIAYEELKAVISGIGVMRLLLIVGEYAKNVKP